MSRNSIISDRKPYAAAVERKLEEQRVVNRVENDMLNDISDPAERERIRQLISN